MILPILLEVSCLTKVKRDYKSKYFLSISLMASEEMATTIFGLNGSFPYFVIEIQRSFETKGYNAHTNFMMA